MALFIVTAIIDGGPTDYILMSAPDNTTAEKQAVKVADGYDKHVVERFNEEQFNERFSGACLMGQL